MKRVITIFILLTAFSFSQIITIIDKGVKRKIYIPDCKMEARYTNHSTKGLIISFKQPLDIEEFEAKYNIKLKKKLSIGYYIFENTSNVGDIELLNKIIKENKDTIKSIRPNWGFGMTPR